MSWVVSLGLLNYARLRPWCQQSAAPVEPTGVFIDLLQVIGEHLIQPGADTFGRGLPAVALKNGAVFQANEAISGSAVLHTPFVNVLGVDPDELTASHFGENLAVKLGVQASNKIINPGHAFAYGLQSKICVGLSGGGHGGD